MKCILCGSNKQHIFAHAKSFGFPLVYYECENCGLVFQSTKESRAVDPAFYEETYRKIYQESVEPTPKDLWVQKQRAEHLLQYLISQSFSAPQRILDIGASSGVLLHTFQAAYDSEVVGVEPGVAYRSYAQERGLNIFPSLEDLLQTNPKRFDLICLLHVLEHLLDPVETLTKIRENLLSERGLILIEVPNLYIHDSFELAHIACYSPHTLARTLRQSGYQLFNMKRHGIPRSSLLNLYLTCIAQPQSENTFRHPIRSESFVALKRKAGLLYRRFVQKFFPSKAWLPLSLEDEV